MADIEKTKYFLKKKIYPLSYQNILKSIPYLFSISQEKYDYCLCYFGYFR